MDEIGINRLFFGNKKRYSHKKTTHGLKAKKKAEAFGLICDYFAACYRLISQVTSRLITFAGAPPMITFGVSTALVTSAPVATTESF